MSILQILRFLMLLNLLLVIIYTFSSSVLQLPSKTLLLLTISHTSLVKPFAIVHCDLKHPSLFHIPVFSPLAILPMSLVAMFSHYFIIFLCCFLAASQLPLIASLSNSVTFLVFLTSIFSISMFVLFYISLVMVKLLFGKRPIFIYVPEFINLIIINLY